MHPASISQNQNAPAAELEDECDAGCVLRLVFSIAGQPFSPRFVQSTVWFRLFLLGKATNCSTTCSGCSGKHAR
jgi:hypothetical protein